jgi:hypothetical protein
MSLPTVLCTLMISLDHDDDMALMIPSSQLIVATIKK